MSDKTLSGYMWVRGERTKKRKKIKVEGLSTHPAIFAKQLKKAIKEQTGGVNDEWIVGKTDIR